MMHLFFYGVAVYIHMHSCGDHGYGACTGLDCLYIHTNCIIYKISNIIIIYRNSSLAQLYWINNLANFMESVYWIPINGIFGWLTKHLKSFSHQLPIWCVAFQWQWDSALFNYNLSSLQATGRPALHNFGISQQVLHNSLKHHRQCHVSHNLA